MTTCCARTDEKTSIQARCPCHPSAIRPGPTTLRRRPPSRPCPSWPRPLSAHDTLPPPPPPPLYLARPGTLSVQGTPPILSARPEFSAPTDVRAPTRGP